MPRLSCGLLFIVRTLDFYPLGILHGYSTLPLTQSPGCTAGLLNLLLLSAHLLSASCDRSITLGLAVPLNNACCVLPKATKSRKGKRTKPDKTKTCRLSALGHELSHSASTSRRKGDWSLSLAQAGCHPARENECRRGVCVCVHECASMSMCACACACTYAGTYL